MDLIFEQITEPDIFVGSGWNGTDIPCKQRTGQKNMKLTKQFTVTLPDKVDAKWYALLSGKLAGMNCANLRHNIKVIDRTPFLNVAYQRMLREQGLDFNILTVNPNVSNFVHKLGKGIITFKQLAKTYL